MRVLTMFRLHMSLRVGRDGYNGGFTHQLLAEQKAAFQPVYDASDFRMTRHDFLRNRITSLSQVMYLHDKGLLDSSMNTSSVPRFVAHVIREVCKNLTDPFMMQHAHKLIRQRRPHLFEGCRLPQSAMGRSMFSIAAGPQYRDELEEFFKNISDYRDADTLFYEYADFFESYLPTHDELYGSESDQYSDPDSMPGQRYGSESSQHSDPDSMRGRRYGSESSRHSAPN